MGIHVSPLPCTSLPPPSPPHPSRLSQSTAFGCPASCIEFPMTLCLPMGMYVSMLFSQIIPPSPPTESTSLFFLSAPPLLPRVGLLNAGRLEDPDGWLKLENFILIFWSLVPCPEFGPSLKYRAIMDEAFFLCKNQWSQSITCLCKQIFCPGKRSEVCLITVPKAPSASTMSILSSFTWAPGEHPTKSKTRSSGGGPPPSLGTCYIMW